MAATHAGFKRSYHEMTGVLEGPIRSGHGTSTSTSQSPLQNTSRASSRQPEYFQAYSQKDYISAERKVSFEPSASLVLVGIRGVGKSTLGVLAAAAYNRRVVEVERAFVEATGTTAAAFRRANGTVEYRNRHERVLTQVLQTYDSGAVIVCSFGDLEGNGSGLLQKFAQAHPVVHVTRDSTGIQSHLRVWTEERINELQKASSHLLRSCSNFEFLNLSENYSESKKLSSIDGARPEAHSPAFHNGNFLALKRVERDFLRFLRNVIGDHERGKAHQSAYPFSQVDVDARNHTFAVKVRASEVLSNAVDLDEVQVGADCVELVANTEDGTGHSITSRMAMAFAVVRRESILPIMLSVQRDEDQPTQSELLDLIDYGLRLGPELCTVDLCLDDVSLKRLTTCKHKTKVVCALHMRHRPKEGWNDPIAINAYKRAASLGHDFVKVTMPADTVDDAFALQTFYTAAEVLNLGSRLIAYGTGTKGRPSQCFNKHLNPVHPPIHSTSGRLAPESKDSTLTAKTITQALFATFLLEPLRFFIYGADVSYSLSPAMHNAAYEACGMSYSYEAISSDSLENFERRVRAADFGGAALAQPFKTMAIAIMEGLSPHARAIGAVNTIVPICELLPDGSIPNELAIVAQRHQQGPAKGLYGFNTDWIGIRACIRRGLSPANTIRPQSSAVVCGAGGMARAAVYSCISLGIKNIFICNRTLHNATAIVQHYNELIDSGEIAELSSNNAAQTRIRVLDSFSSPWPADVRQPTIIVSCIPRQAAGGPPTNFSLPEGWLKSPTGGVVVEVAYRQPVSPVTHQIKQRAHTGWIFMDGFDVLPEQAFSQFELFTGRRAPRKLMREEILKYYPVEEE